MVPNVLMLPVEDDSIRQFVGFSSSFHQTAASAALAHRLKQLKPDLRTVLGGANCEGEMGEAVAEHFECFDVVVSGEGEKCFPKVCVELMRLLSRMLGPP